MRIAAIEPEYGSTGNEIVGMGGFKPGGPRAKRAPKATAHEISLERLAQAAGPPGPIRASRAG